MLVHGGFHNKPLWMLLKNVVKRNHFMFKYVGYAQFNIVLPVTGHLDHMNVPALLCNRPGKPVFLQLQAVYRKLQNILNNKGYLSKTLGAQYMWGGDSLWIKIACDRL